MTILSTAEREALAQSLVAEFGVEPLVPNRYLFEQVIRIPTGWSDCKLSLKTAFDGISATEILIIFDAQPQNAPAALQASEYLGARGELGFVVDRAVAREVIDCFSDCDMFLTDSPRSFWIAGCHEDKIQDGQRYVWRALRNR
jgi:hypothetical protein